MKTVLLVNQKGGSGKTTIADELVFNLERKGHKVTFQSLDAQGGSIHYGSMPDEDTEYRVIDSPGAMPKEFKNWCSAADIIIIPTKPGIPDLAPFNRTYSAARQAAPKAHIGIVVNFYDARRVVDRNFVEEFVKPLMLDVFAYIPSTTQVARAQAEQISVFDYDRNSEVAKAFDALADKVLSL
ncbi:MAG: AAA family ATPase [Coriobacteriales bacterium]|jgi:chromosome partitioning protein|nr:AAA family ATPase [Coriobacteriales bacterium]